MPTIIHTIVRGAAAAVVLLPACLMTVPAASADEPGPPATMSTVGGARLGRPGTQVRPIAGAEAPAVPEALSSRSWIVADAESGKVLAAHNAHWPLPPASTLKMLFADTLLPKFDKETEHLVLPEDLAGLGAGSSAVGVKEDLTYKVDDLWKGVFLASGNDAVHTLAAMNGGVAKTVREMNERARELGAEDTHVVSPDGYDAEGQRSSAYDLTLIARSGMQKAQFRAYAATPRAKFPGGYEDKKARKREFYRIQTTNRLLIGDHGLEPYKGLAGIKNGYTSKAGYTFTGVAQRGERKLLVTVMNPEDEGRNAVYEETAKLFDWGFEAAGKVRPVGALVPPVSEREAGRTGTDGNGNGTSGDARNTAADRPSGGAGTALGIAGATLAVLGATACVVHRRWPLPTAITRPRPPRERK